MFVQFKGLIVNNKKQYVYNNVEDIYSLGSLAEFFTKNNVAISGNNVMIFENANCTSKVPSASRSTCTAIANAMGAEYIYYTDSNIVTVKSTVASSSLNQDMKDFVERLNADKVEGRKRLIAKFLNGDFATVIIPDKLPEYTPIDTTVTITLNANGGTVDKSILTYDNSSATYGSNLTSLSVSRSNYSFDGWYTAASGGTKITSSTVVGDNKTIYAHWTEASKFNGTIYRWSEDSWALNQNISGFTEGTDYVTDVKNVKTMNSRAANYYLKHTVVNNVVTENYLCINVGGWKCLQGGNSSYFESNKSILQGVESWFESHGGYCLLNSVKPICNYDAIFDTVYAFSEGVVKATEYDYSCCVIGVYSDGSSLCKEQETG